jgi:hypothetical protein
MAPSCPVTPVMSATLSAMIRPVHPLLILLPRHLRLAAGEAGGRPYSPFPRRVEARRPSPYTGQRIPVSGGVHGGGGGQGRGEKPEAGGGPVGPDYARPRYARRPACRGPGLGGAAEPPSRTRAVLLVDPRRREHRDRDRPPAARPGPAARGRPPPAALPPASSAVSGTGARQRRGSSCPRATVPSSSRIWTDRPPARDEGSRGTEALSRSSDRWPSATRRNRNAGPSSRRR